MEETIKRNLLRYAVGRQIFCANPKCHIGLDVSRAVHVEIKADGRTFAGAFCIPCYEQDAAHNAKLLRFEGVSVEILDGRVLFPPPAPRAKKTPRPQIEVSASRKKRAARLS